MDPPSDEALRQTIRDNAQEICRLQATVNETFALCGRSKEHEAQWQEACRKFHERYDALAFPGGYDAGIAGLQASDAAAVDAALCFLEVRPYFFRSGYMFKELLRTVKRAAQNRTQAQRLDRIVAAYAAYRATRRRTTDPVAAAALRRLARRMARPPRP